MNTRKIISYVRTLSSCKKNCLPKSDFSGFLARTLGATVLGWIITNTVEALVSGHPQDAQKVSVTGASCLWECKNTESV